MEPRPPLPSMQHRNHAPLPIYKKGSTEYRYRYLYRHVHTFDTEFHPVNQINRPVLLAREKKLLCATVNSAE